MSENWTDLDEARECRAENPHRALKLANRHIAVNPEDFYGYFSRHLTLKRLGNHHQALADCTRALELNPQCGTYRARSEIYRTLGDYNKALADLNQSYEMDYEHWRTSFGPHLRADTLARLGRLNEALADCRLIRDDHWMPEHNGLPGGTKEEFIAEIKRRAAIARSS